LGVDLVDELKALPGHQIFHPLLTQIYWRERDFLEGPPDRPRALVVEGTLFVDDLSQALQREGYATWTWSIVSQSTAENWRIVQRLDPKWALAINYCHGLAELCAKAEVPVLIWEIDPSIEPVSTPKGDVGDAHFFSWSRPHVGQWRSAGFESAHYLPLAANPEHRRPLELTRAEQSRYESDICFVGSSLLSQVVDFRAQLQDGVSMWLKRSGRDPRHAPTVVDAILMHQRAELQRYVIPELVAGSMPGFLAEMKALKVRYDPIMLLGELAAAERRLSVMATMGEMGIHVWGDAGWRSVGTHGVRFRGSAGHREELNKIYNAARIHIDIGRIYQLDIVTMRVFDVISCGGFVIAERNKALLQLFREGEEIVTWTNVEELKEKCRHYLAHPEEATAIAQRGRERLLKDHSIQSRLRRMVEVASTSG
jgi:spore maturation protein CgeB